MSFWKYTRDRESDDYSTTGEINNETGTPAAHDEIVDGIEDDIADTFTSQPESNA